MARKDAQPGAKEVAAARRQTAFELRKTGLPYREIGLRLGVSEPQAYKDVQSVLQKLAALELDKARELRQLDSERLDAALEALWPNIVGGKGWAIDRMISIMDRRARLFGLDMPTKIAPTDPTGENEYANAPTDERLTELNKLLDALRARQAEQVAGSESL